MRTKLGLSQLKAWGGFIVSHARVFNEIERRMAQQEDILPFHWYDVLYVINATSKDKRLKMSEVAELIVTSKSALTRSVDKMVDEGLIRKVPCGKDKRVLYATMTAKGHAALRKSWPFYKAQVQDLFGQYLSNEDARNLTKILMKLGRYQNKRSKNTEGP